MYINKLITIFTQVYQNKNVLYKAWAHVRS